MALANRSRVLVTRPQHRADALIHALERHGLCPVHVPLIAFEPVPHTLPDADLYLLTSATALEHAPLPDAPIAVVGTATAEALRRLGREPALMAENRAEDLERRLRDLPGHHVHLRAEHVERALGHESVVVYRTVEPPAVALPEVDVITLASGSAARHLARLGPRAPIVSIGPSTSRVCRELGLRVSAEASPHTSEGLAAAVAGLS